MKLPHYFKQNILAASLHPMSYEKNPGFVGFIKRTGLPFEPYEEFRAANIVSAANSTVRSPNRFGTPMTCSRSRSTTTPALRIAKEPFEPALLMAHDRR